MHIAARLSAVLAAYALIGGAISFAGWALDVPRLTDWNGDAISIQPNASVLALCAGAAVLLQQWGFRRIALGLGGFIAAIGALSLLQNVAGVDLGFNQQLLFGRPWGSTATALPGLMGVPASLSFTLIGTALALLTWPGPGPTAALRRSVSLLAFGVSALLLFPLAGQLAGAELLYAVTGLSAIALQTSTLLLATSVALLLAVPEQQPMRLLLADSRTGRLARAVVLIVLLAPPLIGWLVAEGTTMALYDARTGGVLLLVGIAVVLLGALWRALAMSERSEIAERRSDRRIVETLESIPEGFCTLDAGWRYTYINSHGARMMDRQPKDFVGRTLQQRFLDVIGPANEPRLRQAMQQRVAQEWENRADAAQRWHAIKAWPTDDGGVALSFRDITDARRVAAKLREREKEFASLFMASSVGMLQADPTDRRILRANRALARITGYSEAELLEMTVEELNYPGDQERDRAYHRRVMAVGSGFEIEKRFLRKDGKVVWVQVTGDLLRDDRGRPVRTFAVVQDITARKEAELALAESEARFRLALQGLPVAVFSCGRDLRFTWVFNPLPPVTDAALFIGRRVDELLPFASVRELLEMKQRVLLTGAGERREIALAHDGVASWFDVCVEAARDADGRINGLRGTVTDVTERRRAEELRRRNERTIAELVERAPFGIYIVDEDFRIAHMNAASQRGAFAHVRPVIGRDFAEAMRILWPEPVAAQIVAVFRHTLATGEPYRSPGLTETRADTGAVESYEWELHRIALPDGRNGVVCHYYDSTRLRQAQEALRESERRFRVMADQSPILIWVTDARGQVQLVNRAYCDFFGVSEGEVARPAGWVPLVHPDDAARYVSTFMESLATCRPWSARARVRAASGQWCWVDSRSNPRFTASGEFLGVAGCSFDVTEQVEAEEALKASEARLQLAISAGSAAAWELDLMTGRAIWSDSHFDLLGLQPTPDRGATQAMWEEAIVADDLPAVRAEWERAQREYDIYRSEHRIRRADDDRIVHVRAAGRFFYNSEGAAIQSVGVVFDVTAAKEAERVLREADRRKDEFLATLAHELRNPLAPVRNAVEILRLKGPPQPEVQWARDIIDRQVKRMTRLIDDLLDLGRIGAGRIELKRERINLAQAMREAVEASQPLIEQCGQTLDVQPPGQPIYVHADLTRLAQIFCNLLNNAAKYSEPGGQIVFRAERQGGGAVISVRDTGLGIPADMLPRVFDMFTQVEGRLERSKGGLGIGLSLVKKLAELHGGKVEARSDGPGKGSEFTVSLPALPEAAPAQRDSDAAIEPAAAGRRILIVDDNTDAAETLAMMMRILGHDTRVAFDGREALQAAAEFHPEVVLLDIGMPKMNGYDVARALRGEAWAQKLVLVAVTGWGQEEDRRRAQESGFDHHFVKPVAPGTLMTLLASLPSAAHDAASRGAAAGFEMQPRVDSISR